MLLTERVTAALGARYRIERELGAGGMATVFLATDLKHDREVAVKVLRDDIAVVLGVERFLAEVKISARLDHPHILTLIDSGEADGLLYYVMPFVRGESLRARIDREKQLPIDEALSIVKQVASALDFAHARGVVHRDIKPENILLHEGEAVLADFGIALALQEAGGDRLTQTGLSLGTPRYMSPEQATGDRIVDARSDVYSLAAVLYEMLAGETPVTGASAQAIIAKLLTERPVSLRVVRNTITPALDDAVQRGLAKVPADRFRSAGELARAADTGSTTAAIGASRSVARKRTLVLVAGAIALVAIAGVGVYVRVNTLTTAMPFAGAVMEPLTTSGRAYSAIPSPDGSQYAYSEETCEPGVCRGDLMIRDATGEGIAAIVAEPDRVSLPLAWAPDGRTVLLGTFDMPTQRLDGIYTVSQRGGAPRRIPRALFADFVAYDTLVVVADGGPPFWLLRVVPSTGMVVDSVRLPFERAITVVVHASRSGRWLVGQAMQQVFTDSQLLLIFDRAGQPTDSVRLDVTALYGWDRSQPDALLIDSILPGADPNNSDAGRVLVRRRVDARGRLGPAEALATHEASAMFRSISADGNQLFFDRYESGEITQWTATRPNTRASFTAGRLLESARNPASAPLSPGGRWIRRTRAPAAGSNRRRVEVEDFAGGERTLLEPALADYRDIAFSSRDDSVALAAGDGANRFRLTVYALPSGKPVRHESYPGESLDLEWLSDGRFASFQRGGNSVRVFATGGETRDFPFPDSLGIIYSSSRSPTKSELAILSTTLSATGMILILSRMDMITGEVRLITRVQSFSSAISQVWWSTDGYVRFSMVGGPQSGRTLVRVPEAGGAIEADLPVTFAPKASVDFLSHDGLRAIVSSETGTTDVGVMRVPKPRR